MPSIAVNAIRNARPLWAGVAIMSPVVKSYGTLGCFASDVAGVTNVVTAKHVLVAGAVTPGLTVSAHQPDYRLQNTLICTTASFLTDSTGEVIAVPLDAGISFVSAVLGVGPWADVVAPTVGVLVVKSGVSTGVTIGRIASVGTNFFEVAPLGRLPQGFETTSGGDSGAAWLLSSTRAVVGIHLGELGNGRARAARVDVSLPQMGLALTPGVAALP